MTSSDGRTKSGRGSDPSGAGLLYTRRHGRKYRNLLSSSLVIVNSDHLQILAGPTDPGGRTRPCARLHCRTSAPISLAANIFLGMLGT